ALARAARGPLDPRTLLGVFVGGVLTALAHPYSLPLVLAFAIGATVETPLLRTPQAATVLAVLVTGCVATYLMLVPVASRGLAGQPVAGLLASYRSCEVNRAGSAVAALLAAWTAWRAWNGATSLAAAVSTLGVAVLAVATGLPVLPLWLAWTVVKCVQD